MSSSTESNETNRRTVPFVLAIGVLSVSCGSIFVRLSRDAAGLGGAGYSLVMCAARLTLASLLLVPMWRSVPTFRNHGAAFRASLLAGVFMGVHFATWITSLAWTSIAASTTLVTTTPIWVSLFSWLFWAERPSRFTLLGIVVALAGGVVIGLSQGGVTGTNAAVGNLLAVAGAISGALYFLLGRRAQKAGFTIGAHVAVAYSTAAALLLPLPLFFGVGYFGHPPAAYLWIALMAIFPQMIGHTSFNWAMGRVSPILVSLVMLAEPVCASVLGYVVFGEAPGGSVVVGALVLVVGVGIAIVGPKR